MSWLFSQVLVEEYLGAKCLDGEQSVLSNGSNTQQAYCAPDKMTNFSRVSRFGMTFKPLTESLGVELLTLYLEDFHAKTLAQQEKGQVLKVSDQECGNIWQESLAKYDQDSCSWKTPQCLLEGESMLYSGTYPKWGLMRDGELFQQPVLVQTTKEKESGLWLTPSTVNIPTRSKESMEKRLDYRKKIGRNGVGAGCLSEQVTWSQNGPPIGYITRETFPTPIASAGGPGKNLNNPRGIHQGNPLASAVKMSMMKNQTSETSGAPVGGSLNPVWVEWLMGFPLGWTDLKPLEMHKSHYVQQQHGEY